MHARDGATRGDADAREGSSRAGIRLRDSNF